jgi:restriction endonuclease Mrr
MRYMATLLVYWAEKGEMPRSVSELARLSLETLAEILVVSRKVEFVGTQELARSIMQRAGLLTQKMEESHKVNKLKAQIQEDLSDGLVLTPLEGSELVPTSYFQSKKLGSFSKPAHDAVEAEVARRLRDQGGDGLDERVANEQRRTQNFMQGLLTVPENIE